MTNYPNLEALATGRVSGNYSEWPEMRPEASQVLAEVKRLRAMERAAIEMVQSNDAFIVETDKLNTFSRDSPAYKALKRHTMAEKKVWRLARKAAEAGGEGC